MARTYTKDQIRAMFPGVKFSRSATGRETASIPLAESDKNVVRLCSNIPEGGMSSVGRVVAAREILGLNNSGKLRIGGFQLNSTDTLFLET